MSTELKQRTVKAKPQLLLCYQQNSNLDSPVPAYVLAMLEAGLGGCLFLQMSVIMILMFLLAWSPYSVVCLWACFGNPRKIPPSMAIIAPLFAKSSTFYNPCIYVAANKK